MLAQKGQGGFHAPVEGQAQGFSPKSSAEHNQTLTLRGRGWKGGVINERLPQEKKRHQRKPQGVGRAATAHRRRLC